MSFFFSGSLSSQTYLSISWLFKFLMSLMKSISFLSFNYFKVVDLTFQDWGSAWITFLIFFSLSMESLREERPLVIFIDFMIISSIDSFSFILNFSYWECKKSLAIFTWEAPSWITTRLFQISYSDFQFITLEISSSLSACKRA